MKWNKLVILCLGVIALSALTGCATSKVERVEVDEVVDLSGKWNDIDAQMTAEAMIQDCLNASWLDRFYKFEARNPIVIVGTIKNRTSEHINTYVVTKALESELINAGQVDFVASPEERDQIRMEREDQRAGYTDPVTMAEMGKEFGADYMLIGSVNSVVDAIKRQYAVYYQVNLELIDLETNSKVWIGQKEIKKVSNRHRFSL